LIATACLSTYGLATFQGDDSSSDSLQSAGGWSQFAGGFFVGATGGAFVAYLLIANFSIVDKIFTGAFN